jgi:CubicO group peptidase (beta-lactamase class C family)
MKRHVDSALTDAVRHGVFPSADLLVAKNGEIIHHGYYGDSREGTHYDVASFTKPLCTSTLVVQLIAEGKLDLNTTLDHFYGSANESHAHITIENLLNHTSGLPAWKPYYRELPSSIVATEEGKRSIIDACVNEPVEYKPGEQIVYSDIGYILLGDIIERVSGMPLDKIFKQKISDPLGLKDTFFIKLGDTSEEAKMHRRFAATEDCHWRERVIHGQVHDQNCYAMGGVGGHAGLFSTAQDIHLFLTAFMPCFEHDGGFLPHKLLASIFHLKNDLITPPRRGVFVGGWDTPSASNSAAGHYSSRHAIGHLAYTGCSLWIDQQQHFWMILLTNRIHPSTTNEKIKAFRPRIHDLVYTTLVNPQ